MKIRPVGTELFHGQSDRQMDRKHEEANRCLRDSSNAPQMKSPSEHSNSSEHSNFMSSCSKT